MLLLCYFRYKTGIFKFGHSESLVPLMSLLGLFKDDKEFRADNFNEMGSRKFRATRISPFSANIAFILHKCDNDFNGSEVDEESKMSQQYKLQLILNERPETFPFCDDELCPYSTVRQTYQKYIDKCDIDKLCELNASLEKDEL